MLILSNCYGIPMTEILNVPPNVLLRLSEAAQAAAKDGRTFRFTLDHGNLKWKVGEGMWTPPYRVDIEKVS